MTRKRLSVVIPTRDRPDQLAACLRTLLADLQPGDDVLVVDSASANGDAVRAVAEAAGVRLLRAPLPGTSRARNLGWRNAFLPLVAFLDDDVEVLPGWSAAVVEAFGDNDFVTGWIGVPDRSAAAPEPNPLMVAEEPFRIDRSRRGLLGASANLAVKVEALQRIGGFDERLGPGCAVPAAEDHDLLDRLLLAGYVGCYSPLAKVEHEQWRTRRESLRLHWRMGLGAGARLGRLARRDRARWPMVARELVVDDELGSLARSLRAGYRTGTVYALLRLVGTLAGLVAGLTASPWRA